MKINCTRCIKIFGTLNSVIKVCIVPVEWIEETYQANNSLLQLAWKFTFIKYLHGISWLSFHKVIVFSIRRRIVLDIIQMMRIMILLHPKISKGSMSYMKTCFTLVWRYSTWKKLGWKMKLNISFLKTFYRLLYRHDHPLKVLIHHRHVSNTRIL